jgi:hypothetical protein
VTYKKCKTKIMIWIMPRDADLSASTYLDFNKITQPISRIGKVFSLLFQSRYRRK